MDNIINNITENGSISIDMIGFFGPIITSCITFLHLLYLPKYLVSFLIFFVVNMGVNRWLKLWLRHSRPANGKSILGESYNGADEYGMPSAHAQTVFYSTIYLYFAKDSINWLFIGVCIGIITMYQRWSYRRHTIPQLIAGMSIGSMIAYIGATAAKYWITGQHFW